MKNLAIIPARGGSKRIPHKNIREFLGHPIISYSIEAAKKSGLFDEIMVSTDDREIADIAGKYGAHIPFMRSEATANDFATLADVIEEVIYNYEKQGIRFDHVCCILATAPLITSENINQAYQKLITSDFTTVHPLVAFSYPILRSLEMDENGNVTMKWPEYAKTRSQDLSPVYHDAGTFYWHKIETWRNGIKKRGGIVMDEIYVQDIDTETDWKLAEMKYLLLNRCEK